MKIKIFYAEHFTDFLTLKRPIYRLSMKTSKMQIIILFDFY